MKDPYELLGIARTATSDDIRKAYRRLAKKLHPDLHPGNKEFEERFKDVSIANDLLSDDAKRKRFDNGEIDASGAEKPPRQYYKDYAESAPTGHAYDTSSGYQDFAQSDDIFAELFRRQAHQSRHARGADAQYGLAVDFLDAVLGAKKRLTMPGGEILDVNIPAGLQDGQTLRLKGKGGAAPGQGDAGDALVQINVRPHAFFTRVGNDIQLELPLTLKEAVLGARIEVPTPSGPVMLSVPKGTNTGVTMRLKGKGVARRSGSGDELITFKVMLPPIPDAALDIFLTGWTPTPHYDPRKGFAS